MSSVTTAHLSGRVFDLEGMVVLDLNNQTVSCVLAPVSIIFCYFDVDHCYIRLRTDQQIQLRMAVPELGEGWCTSQTSHPREF